MSRYIDAEELIFIGLDNPDDDHLFEFVPKEFIDNAPTADVVEVVHGENISKDGFLCSVCKFGDFDGFHGYEPNFCPNCGADMRGGQNELHKRL